METEETAGREHWTPEERALYDARSEEEAWDLARRILAPWVEATHPIGSPELLEVMEEALGQVDENLDRARRKLARLRSEQEEG
ncbi:MAG: hypothetical protein M3N18_00245 [Actinomycetota bacterium]|nr:hypothetical protein [Actinomycetota bacterium]